MEKKPPFDIFAPLPEKKTVLHNQEAPWAGIQGWYVNEETRCYEQSVQLPPLSNPKPILPNKRHKPRPAPFKPSPAKDEPLLRINGHAHAPTALPDGAIRVTKAESHLLDPDNPPYGRKLVLSETHHTDDDKLIPSGFVVRCVDEQHFVDLQRPGFCPVKWRNKLLDIPWSKLKLQKKK